MRLKVSLNLIYKDGFLNGTELITNPVLGFSTFGENKAFVTVFDFKMQNTGKPYIRIGSNGNYQRFALTQDGSKVDFKIRKSGNENLLKQ